MKKKKLRILALVHDHLVPPEDTTGIDVLERDHFATLQGAKVAIVTNQTGVDRNGQRTIDILKA